MTRIHALILDTESPEFISWQEVYREHGVELSLSTWGDHVIGTSADNFDLYAHLEDQIGYTVDRDAIEAKRWPRHMALIEEQSIMPGVERAIADARRLDLKLGIASTSSCGWVEGHLTRLGLLQHFDAVRCADHVERVKPAPDLYLAALDALDVAANEALALEDSPFGVMAAKRAGLFCVAVPNVLTTHFDLSLADMRLESLDSTRLEDLLSRFENTHATTS